MDRTDENQSVYWQHMKLDSNAISPFRGGSEIIDTQDYLTRADQHSSIAVLDVALVSSHSNASLYGVDFDELDFPTNTDIMKEWFRGAERPESILTQWKGYVDDMVYGKDVYPYSTQAQNSDTFDGDSFIDWQFLKHSGLLMWAKVLLAISLILLSFFAYLRNQPAYRTRTKRAIRRR